MYFYLVICRMLNISNEYKHTYNLTVHLAHGKWQEILQSKARWCEQEEGPSWDRPGWYAWGSRGSPSTAGKAVSIQSSYMLSSTILIVLKILWTLRTRAKDTGRRSSNKWHHLYISFVCLKAGNIQREMREWGS